MRGSTRSILRRRLLMSSGLLMISATVATQPLRAQAFNGTPTVASGTVRFDRTAPGAETITQSTPVAIINWSPSDTATGGGAINFLPAGTTATYRTDGTALMGDFTAINRILPTDPTRQVALNGTVNSLIYTAAQPNGTPGGQVWFYSPGGILVGSTGVFNVGSLLLTADDPAITGGTPYGANNFVSFVGGTDSTATVAVSAGATITASPEGSYVALIAPRVVQSGTVRVNGQAAYVAGEQVSITFKSPGQLFDISVPVGSFVGAGDNTVLRHDGVTTGPASTGANDASAIYLVASPKNAAIRTLLQVNGQFGFDNATRATSANGSIVLSNGISNGFGGGSLNGGQLADVSITGSGTVSSSLTANSQLRNLDLTVAGTSSLAFTGDVTFSASNLGSAPPAPTIAINVRDSGTLSIGGTLNVFAAVGGSTASATGLTTPGVGGTIGVTVDAGGALSVTGGTILNASRAGGAALANTPAGAGGDATGGAITINSAGAVTLASLVASAVGVGGAGVTAGAPAGTGAGGTVNVVSNGGSFRVAGSTTLDVEGYTSSGSSGTGIGGSTQLAVTGGTATFGAVFVNADGAGSAGAVGGVGRAGQAVVTVSGGSASFVSLNAEAASLGGTASVGAGGAGDGSAALAALRITGGSLAVSGNTAVSATAFGGAGPAGGGSAKGGVAELTVAGGALRAGSVISTAQAFGGDGSAGGPGGAAAGGTALAQTTGGTLTATSYTGTASASGGAGGSGTSGGAGGPAAGGVARAIAQAGTFTAGANLSLDSGATGGAGGAGTSGAGGPGGVAQGGVSAVLGMGGTFSGGTTTSSIAAAAVGGAGGTGFFGDGGAGGTASGGIATADSQVAGGGVTLAGLTIDVSGTGGQGADSRSINGVGAIGSGGAGGTGSAGDATLLATGAMTASSVRIIADGTGGAGGAGGSDPSATGTRAGGTGGAANGGLAYAASRGGVLTLTGTRLSITADAYGSAGGDGGVLAGGVRGAGGAGGIATAGTGSAADNFRRGAYLIGQSGTIDFTAIANTRGPVTTLVEAVGYAGAGGLGSGAGGAATGGVAQLGSQGATVRGGAANVLAFSYGGAGGAATTGAGGKGGTAQGGTALVSAGGSGAAALTLTTLNSYADGFGGDGGAGGTGTMLGGAGGAGGDGVAGSTQVLASQGTLSIVSDNLNSAQNAGGGNGGAGGTATAAGGTGGAGGAGGLATGGTIVQTAAGGTATIGNVRLWSYVRGGNGGAGGTGTIAGAAGAGGNGTGGDLRLSAGVGAGGAAGAFTANTLTFQFDIGGGTGATPGTASGGVATVAAQGAPVTLASIITTTISTGGATFNPPLPGVTIGGATINLFADNAPLTVSGVASLPVSGVTTLRTSNGGVLSAGAFAIQSATALVDQTGAAATNPVRSGLFGAQVTGDFTATAAILSQDSVNIVAGGNLRVGDVTSANNDILLGAPGNIVAGSLSAGDSITLQTPRGSVTAGALAAGLVAPNAPDYLGSIGIDAAGNVAVGSVATRSLVGVASRGGSLSTGAITAGDDIVLLAANAISAGSLVVQPLTGTVDIAKDGANVLIGGVSALPAFGTFQITDGTVLTKLRTTIVPTAGSISAGDISASGALSATAGTTLTLGTLTGLTRADLLAGGDLRLGGFASAAGRLGIVGGGGVTITGDVRGASGVDVSAQRTLAFTNIVAPGATSVRLGANGSVTGGTLTAQTVKVASGGTVTLGAVSATAGAGTSVVGRLAILGRGNVMLTSATSATNLEVYSTTGSIDAGSLTAPDYAIALAGGGIRIGTLTSNAPYLAGIATARSTAFGRGTDPTTLTAFTALDPSLFVPDQTSVANTVARLYGIAPVAAPGTIAIGSLIGANLVASSLTSVTLAATSAFAPTLVVAPAVSLTVSGDVTLPAAVQASDSLTVLATGAIRTGALNVASNIDLEAPGGITTGNITMQAAANSGQGGFLYLASSKGGVSVGDVRNADTSIYAQGDVNFGSILTDTNSETNIYANGAVTGGDVRAAEIEIAGGKTVTLGNIAQNAAPDPFAAHLDGLAVLGVGNVTIASATSRNRAELYSVNGSIDVGTVTAPELIVALAGSGIRIGTATTAGPAYFAGFGTTQTRALDSKGARIFIDYGDYATADLAARGDVNLLNLLGTGTTPNGAELANVVPTAAAGAISVGGLAAGQVVAASGTSVALTAPGALTVRAVTAPQVAITANGLLSISGSVDGGVLALASTDIAIAPKATLGSATTTRLTLTANTGAVRLGGTTQGTGYTLDAAEATTINADAVTVSAPGTQTLPATVTLDTLALRGSLVSDGAGTITLQTPGSVNVIGKVELTGAATGDVLAITAGGAVRVTTPGGGIRLTGANGLGGTLRLSGASVIVASDAAVADVAAASTVDARAARLARNDGPTDAAGYLQANAISLTASRAIYVQNSGTTAVPGGLTAGVGGLTVGTSAESATSPTEVILFGRLQTAAGGFITDSAQVAAISFTRTNQAVTAFAPGSVINGCLIATGSCTGTATVISPTIPMAIANIADVVSAVVQATNGSTNGSSTRSALNPTITTATLLDFAPLTSFADIETPVTGIGNDDLWADEPGTRKKRDQ